MLFPKKVKHRKWQTARKSAEKLARPDTRGITVSFGSYAMKATTPGRITSNQIEAARKVLSRACGKTGKMWIRVFPDKPISKKPLETRMGKGKAATDKWVAVVRPGRMLFEVGGVPEILARASLRIAATKLPIRTRFVKRGE
jgi:large subunit ribosomal protein L16